MGEFEVGMARSITIEDPVRTIGCRESLRNEILAGARWRTHARDAATRSAV